MRRRPSLLLTSPIAGLAGAVLTVCATGAIAPAQQPAVNAASARLRLDAIVTDHDRPVTGLAAADFLILVDGIAQRIESVRPVDRLSVVLVLDTSAAVLPVDRLNQFVAAGTAVANALRPSDVASLVSFSAGARLEIRDTSDPAALMNRLMEVSHSIPAGDDSAPFLQGISDRERRTKLAYSAAWDALFLSASLVAGSPGRPVVVLLSEVSDNASWVFANLPEDTIAFRQAKAATLESLTRSGIVVDQVLLPRTFRVGFYEGGGRREQSRPADETGGMAFVASSPNLPRQLAARLEQLRSGYVISFAVGQTLPTVRRHKITVQLKNRSGDVRSLPQYVANLK